jgi:hypothetical protein
MAERRPDRSLTSGLSAWHCEHQINSFDMSIMLSFLTVKEPISEAHTPHVWTMVNSFSGIASSFGIRRL